MVAATYRRDHPESTPLIDLGSRLCDTSAPWCAALVDGVQMMGALDKQLRRVISGEAIRWGPLLANALRYVFAAFAAALAPIGMACAQDILLNEDEWRGMTEGRTVIYTDKGDLAGWEYYYPGENVTLFVTPEGACVTGIWAFAEDRFCFSYDDSFQCFHHLRRGDRLISQHDRTGAEQVIDEIVDAKPTNCSR